MSISVVVPTLIRGEEEFQTTIKCLARAEGKTKKDFELVIVETGTDYLEDMADIYIHFPEKTCSTNDINAGFRACSGEYIVLLTNDVYVDSGWLERLLECFTYKDCGIATLGSSQFRDAKRDYIGFGIWCSVFMTKKEFFKKYGYFDAINFPNVWDDTDFIMRLALAGYRPYKNYGCIVHHKIGMTQYKNKEHDRQYEENKKRFNEKYKGCGHSLFDFLK